MVLRHLVLVSPGGRRYTKFSRDSQPERTREWGDHTYTTVERQTRSGSEPGGLPKLDRGAGPKRDLCARASAQNLQIEKWPEFIQIQAAINCRAGTGRDCLDSRRRHPRDYTDNDSRAQRVLEPDAPLCATSRHDLDAIHVTTDHAGISRTAQFSQKRPSVTMLRLRMTRGAQEQRRDHCEGVKSCQVEFHFISSLR